MKIKKHIGMILAISAVCGLVGCSKGSKDGFPENETEIEKVQGKYTEISMGEAVSMMDEETGYIILDVRTAEEFAQKHIPDAINVPNETIGSGEITELPDKDQMIFVYCRSGNRSKQASKKLAAAGYTNVYEFGGINDWTGETVSE